MPLVNPTAQLIEATTGASLAGAELSDRVETAATAFRQLPKGPVFLGFGQRLDDVIHYLGARTARNPIALFDSEISGEALRALVERFEPVAIAGELKYLASAGIRARYRPTDDRSIGISIRRKRPSETAVHPDLDLLLTTSGSTGSPKLVRLSRQAVTHNTDAIIDVLGITAEDVAITTLPLFYSYGMSVLNTHLAAGATVVIESGGLVQRPFWEAVDRFGVTSLACVPHQVELLRRLRFDPADHRSVRSITQAGGRLRPELVRWAHAQMSGAGGRLYVMYGQTEAGPRMTTLPPGEVARKPVSVGRALPGGRLAIMVEDGSETSAPGVSGEVVYYGRNVMMGYAEAARDLARGDDQGGRLQTGDLGRLDDDGDLYLEARIKRIGKVFGLRLNLDDIELMVPAPAAAVSGDDKIVVWIESPDLQAVADAGHQLASRLRVHPSGIVVRHTAELPRLANGKVDYQALES